MARLRISILKTILFNLHYFGRKGLKFPVLVGKNFIFKKLGGGGEKLNRIEQQIFELDLMEQAFVMRNISEEYGMLMVTCF